MVGGVLLVTVLPVVLVLPAVVQRVRLLYEKGKEEEPPDSRAAPDDVSDPFEAPYEDRRVTGLVDPVSDLREPS